MGKDEGWIADNCVRRRLPLPKGILEAPQLFEGLELYWEAYQDLSTCRPAGFGGALPIPWTAVADYAEAMRFDEVQTADLMYYVRIMDREFLDWYEQKHGEKGQRGGVSKADVPRGGRRGFGR